MWFSARSSWQQPRLFIPEKLQILFPAHQTWSFLISLSKSNNNSFSFVFQNKRTKALFKERSINEFSSWNSEYIYIYTLHMGSRVFIDMRAFENQTLRAQYFRIVLECRYVRTCIFIDETIPPTYIKLLDQKRNFFCA